MLVKIFGLRFTPLVTTVCPLIAVCVWRRMTTVCHLMAVCVWQRMTPVCPLMAVCVRQRMTPVCPLMAVCVWQRMTPVCPLTAVCVWQRMTPVCPLMVVCLPAVLPSQVGGACAAARVLGGHMLRSLSGGRRQTSPLSRAQLLDGLRLLCQGGGLEHSDHVTLVAAMKMAKLPPHIRTSVAGTVHSVPHQDQRARYSPPTPRGASPSSLIKIHVPGISPLLHIRTIMPGTPPITHQNQRARYCQS